MIDAFIEQGGNDGPAGADGVLRQGADTIFGEAGDDVIYGNHGGDLIHTGSGANTAYGGQDTDTICSGTADFNGESGYDLLSGEQLVDLATEIEATGIGGNAYRIVFDPLSPDHGAAGAIIIRTASGSEALSADWFV